MVSSSLRVATSEAEMKPEHAAEVLEHFEKRLPWQIQTMEEEHATTPRETSAHV